MTWFASLFGLRTPNTKLSFLVTALRIRVLRFSLGISYKLRLIFMSTTPLRISVHPSLGLDVMLRLGDFVNSN
jgi:hypothetical protein